MSKKPWKRAKRRDNWEKHAFSPRFHEKKPPEKAAFFIFRMGNRGNGEGKVGVFDRKMMRESSLLLRIRAFGAENRQRFSDGEQQACSWVNRVHRGWFRFTLRKKNKKGLAKENEIRIIQFVAAMRRTQTRLAQSGRRGEQLLRQKNKKKNLTTPNKKLY